VPVHLSLTTLGCPAWGVERVFSEASRMGYQGVELRCLEGRTIAPDLSAEVRREIRRRAAQSGCPVVALGASSAFSSPDPEERRRQEEDLRGMVALAAEIGAPMVRAYGGGWPRRYERDEAREYGGSFPAGAAEDEVCDRIAESVWRVVPAARAAGVLVVLETHDGLSSARRMRKVLDRLDTPQVQALWDVLHPTRVGETPEEVWGLIGDRVRHVHFKDAFRGPDGRWRAAMDGEGHVPQRRCLQVLRGAGYAGWLTLEWEKYWEPEIAEPEAALPRKLEIVRGWLAELGM
jgi:sugar phosphate isomerase/epimerase